MRTFRGVPARGCEHKTAYGSFNRGTFGWAYCLHPARWRVGDKALCAFHSRGLTRVPLVVETIEEITENKR